MQPHVEGGYYREVYRSDLLVPNTVLPPAFNGSRPVATSIYFLLEAGNFSSLHRIASDEVWHFYAGDPINIFEIETDGALIVHTLGGEPEKDEQLQVVVRAGHWFGAALAPGGSYALTGCTVSPGFDFQDFELADRHSLIGLYPQHAQVIGKLTRK